MLGMTLTHTPSNTTGTVDAETVHPDGRAFVRIADRWFAADEFVTPSDVDVPGPSPEYTAEFIQQMRAQRPEGARD